MGCRRSFISVLVAYVISAFARSLMSGKSSVRLVYVELTCLPLATMFVVREINIYAVSANSPVQELLCGFRVQERARLHVWLLV